MAGFHCYHPYKLSVGDSPELSAEESHHLVGVLRAREGDCVHLFDGSGYSWEGVLSVADKRRALVKINIENRYLPPPWTLMLAQALPKGKVMESIIRRAVEIGVEEIYPLLTERTEVHTEGASFKKKEERWRLAAIEACKQSGNYRIPKIAAIQTLDTFLETTMFQTETFAVICSLEKEATYLEEALSKHKCFPKRTLCLIGPEGDFTEREYAAAYQRGCYPIRLSDAVLRSETAAVYALSILNNRLKERESSERIG